jgi:hypothetical protein
MALVKTKYHDLLLQITKYKLDEKICLMVEYSEKIKLQHLADDSNMILGPGHQTYQVVCNAKN